MTVSELGRSVQTLGPGRTTFDRVSYTADQAYKITLSLPHNIQELVGSGSLVIKLEVDTREEEGWNEVVKTNLGGKKNYKLNKEKRAWDEAEFYCQGEGGHMASIQNQEDNRNVTASVLGLASRNIWVGGTDQEEEGGWRWSDESHWNFAQWDNGYGSRGKSQNCIRFYSPSNRWRDTFCTIPYPFICQSSSLILSGKTNITLSYTAEQLTFRRFMVWYNFTVTSPELLDSWKDKRMTGFRLNWFLRNRNGSSMTEKSPDMLTDWRPADADIRRYKSSYLGKMVQLASLAKKKKNMSRDEIVKKVMIGKAELILSGSIEFTTMCSQGQVKPEHFSKLFSSIKLDLSLDATKTTVNDEDITTGFMIFSVVVYCSESVALSQFLHSLLTTQSPRTIIQATVNTIESDNIKDNTNRQLLNDYFQSLNRTFNFEYGKILMALSSPSELQAMMDKNSPYFTNFSKDIHLCLSGDSCHGLMDSIKSLGALVV